MYQAPIVSAAIGVAFIWSHVGIYLEKEWGWKIPLYLHYYGFLYTMLFYLTAVGMHGMVHDIMIPSNWLHPEATEHFVREVMVENGDMTDLNDTTSTVYQEWFAESDMSEFQRLKWFSMLSPLWVFLTIAVCVYHTHLHVQKIRNTGDGTVGKLCDAPQHDQTIKVLALPVVYGLMSFKAACRMWQVMINHVPAQHTHAVDVDAPVVLFHGYVERKSFLFEMYEANFMVGDIYETIALVTFGHLVMGVMKKKIDAMREQFELTNNNKDYTHYVDQLVISMTTLTVAGVKLFAMSCFLQGVYTIIITTMAFDFPGVAPGLFSRDEANLGLAQQESTKTFMHDFFLGAGFIASFAAIGNIMIIETDYEDLLEEFRPAYKFWGTKVLVSLAFLQSILISVFLTPRGWSVVQSNLFYAAALCLECFLIALFHMVGWGANEEWYGDIVVDKKKEPLMSNFKVASESK